MGRALKRLSLTAWIFIAMALGVLLGAAFPHIGQADWMAALANTFLRLIKSIIAPLIFGTLVYGIAGTGSVKTMGRIGLKAIVYFEVLTTIALFLGLGAVNLVRPGERMKLERTAAETGLSQAGPTLAGTLEHTFPASIIDAMAKGEVLQIVVFSFLFGAACASIGSKAAPVVGFCKSLSEVMFRYTKFVMYLAPIGVGAAMANTIGKEGLAVLLGLGKLVLTLYGTLAIFVFVVLGAVAAIARVPARPFFRAVREPFALAFATASSESALPLALENMERMGIPPHIVAFVLPTGYSFNLDGSALYLSMASLFVAQAAGVHLAFSQQLLMMLTLMLTSKGVAGVPRAALVILAGTFATFGLPLSGVALLLGADALMDMARTSVNLLGNCMATAVVARWEGAKLEPANRVEALPSDPLALHAEPERSTPAG
jgi:proton glutamate symport protein